MRKASFRQQIKRPFRKAALWFQRFESEAGRKSRARKRLDEISRQRLLPQKHIDYLRALKDAEGFEPKVIYDIGACVMHWTNEAERIWPQASFVLFEAMEAVEFIFQRAPRHQYVLGVLSDRDGRELSFFQNELFPGGNSYYRENDALSPMARTIFGEGARVQRIARTLDSLVAERGFAQPDLIKIDVQGAELDVLKGAVNTLAGCRHLILELQQVEYNKGAPLRDVVIDHLASVGFRLVTPLFCDNGPDGDYHFENTRLPLAQPSA